MSTKSFPNQSKPAPARLAQLADFIENAVLHIRIYENLYAGVMHALIFWGVTIQVIGTAILLMQMKLFVPFVELSFPRNQLYLASELIMDLAGGAILLGVLMAAFRRLVLHPKTLQTYWDDVFALTLLAMIPLAGFALEATRLLGAPPAWANWSPIGHLTAVWLTTLGLTSQGAVQTHNWLIWIHAALGLILLASIPYTKMRHLVNTPLNILLRKRESPGIPNKIENIETAELLGVGKVNEFLPIQLLSLDACTRCGRCEEVCPVAQSGSEYSPKAFILSLRESMLTDLVYPVASTNNNPSNLSDLLGKQSPWSCTTCGACFERCPAFVNPVDKVIDLRRYDALTSGKVPKTIADTLRGFERHGNPWSMPASERATLSKGLDTRELSAGDETDVLYYVGCACSYDARGRKAAGAFARLMQNTGIDFGILGANETCCGDMARRMGHEYLFQVFAEQLNQTLQSIKFKRIVTQCAHCYNALKQEYPQLGYHFPVQHASEFLLEIGLGKTLMHSSDNCLHETIAFHDSCYLGRYNQIYHQPRILLHDAGANMVEFVRNKTNSFCCGGGGGHMWMENDSGTRINHIRLDEAINCQAEIIATGCPYCLLMFDDAIRSKGLTGQIQVMDLAEILEKQYL
jgi:Fe-S oxidoreductase/nitrate reductase gamma subunit